MPIISDAAIAGYARNAGLSGQSVAIAVAIALAESGGNTTDHNAVPPDNSYGLWQINMLGSMGPDRRAKLGISSNEELYDPAVNARAMSMISNGGRNWKDWTTYTRGTYLRYYSRGNSAAGTVMSSANTSQAIPIASQNSLASISGFLKLISSPATWVRIGLLTLGVGFVFYGLFKITGDNQLSQGTKALGKAALSAAVKVV